MRIIIIELWLRSYNMYNAWKFKIVTAPALSVHVRVFVFLFHDHIKYEWSFMWEIKMQFIEGCGGGRGSFKNGRWANKSQEGENDEHISCASMTPQSMLLFPFPVQTSNSNASEFVSK